MHLFRISSTSLFVGLLLLLGTEPVAAICCKCVSKNDPKTTICVNTTQPSCDILKTNGKNDDVKSIDCSGEDPICKPVALSGTCMQGPVDEAGFQLMPDAKAAAQKKEAEISKTTAITAPTLNISIPGLQFRPVLVPADNGTIDIPYFAQYIAAIYRYLLGISGVAAAIMIMYGGFKYILAGTGAHIKEGQEVIKDALIGLVLLMGTYTILRTVNPATLGLNPLRVPQVHVEPWKAEQEGSIPKNLEGTKIGNVTLPKNICEGADCKKFCDGTSPIADLPSVDGLASPNDLTDIPKAPGLYGSGKMRKEAVDALVLAGKAALAWPNGPYTIRVNSTYRPLKDQVQLACNKINEGHPEQIGPNVAKPGGSVHGTGLAADLELWKGQERLVGCCTVSTQTTDTKQENAKLLQDIMSSIGWVRYCHEVWHFEWGTDAIPGRSKDCPWPPK